MTISVHDRDPDIPRGAQRDVAIAYQILGDEPVDVVFVPFFGTIRWVWEQPLYARFLERLASFSRLILFDKGGTGLSDRPRWLTVEAQMDDIRAVIDAADSERAALPGAIQAVGSGRSSPRRIPNAGGRSSRITRTHPRRLGPAALRSADDARAGDHLY